MCWTSPGHVEGNDEATFQLILIKQGRRDRDSVRADELLDQPDQLSQQELFTARPFFLHLVVNIARRFEDDPLSTKLLPQTLKVNGLDLCNVGLTLDDRGKFGDLGGLGRIQFKRFYLIPIKGQTRPVNMVDADDVGPTDLEGSLLRDWLDCRLWLGRFRDYAFLGFVRQESKRNTGIY